MAFGQAYDCSRLNLALSQLGLAIPSKLEEQGVSGAEFSLSIY